MIGQNFIRLAELTGLIQDTLDDVFEGKSFWIVADITNHSFKANDERHFFSLVEKAENGSALVAKVDAVAWRVGASKIKIFEETTGQRFQNGLNVLVRVTVSFSPEYGLKLTLIDIDVNFTIGALERQKQEILLRLETECADFIQKIGDRYITRNNQLDFGLTIQKIALITSNNTAGFEDFVHTLQNNPYGYAFYLDYYFTPVQGENNAHLIRQILVDIYKSSKAYDAVVIIRGGGSQTDFLIFETFALGQIVAKFPIPIITGIGHQRNETIVDIMAHSPTKTPTKAAEYIIAHNAGFEEQLLGARKLIANRAQQQIWSKIQALDPMVANIRNYSKMYINHQKGYLEHFSSVVAMMNPEHILRKGFAILYINGKIAADAKQIAEGDTVTISMTDTLMEATINTKQAKNE